MKNPDVLYLENVMTKLLQGNIDIIPELYTKLPNMAYTLINNRFSMAGSMPSLLVDISDILYNNTSLERLPLDDSIYDALFEYCMNNDIHVSVGARPIEFDENEISKLMRGDSSSGLINPVMFIDKDEMVFTDILFDESNTVHRRSNLVNPIEVDRDIDDVYITKRVTNTAHMYPELVGTLRKSRSVIISDVSEELQDDPTYRILERDFFQKHISDGILDPDREFTVVAELKYDGISIEADTSSIIHSARTRGDTGQGVASDMTPLFYGYPFYNLLGEIPDDQRVGVKFEVIMTKQNLEIYNKIRDTEYKNCRSAVVGLTSSSDGYKYRELLSLVPLALSGDFDQLDRMTEVQVINQLYVNDVPLHYAVMHGTYKDILFEIRKFVKEAEEVRDAMPFMYDGVVVTYVDDDIREALGRKDYINQYQEAIKFEALKKSTTFLGYTYTVGQDGRITPMIHYEPVEFFGTIHDKSTGHSYQRVKNLALRVGDMIDVEYVSDVMPYVTKPEGVNDGNTNPVLQFTKKCPACGSSLEKSESGKTMNCPNIVCVGKMRMRISNMLDKLNIKDFGEARLELLPISSFKDLMELSDEDIRKAFPTDGMANKLRDRINELKTRQISDYQMVGSLGFRNVAASSWKSIFENYTLDDILKTDDITQLLSTIPGIGPVRAETIASELPLFIKDLTYISNMDNMVDTLNNEDSLKIRFSGVRDSEFVEYLISKLHDAGEGSVTKDTDILIIPNAGYTSGKVTTANRYDIKIMSIDEARRSL